VPPCSSTGFEAKSIPVATAIQRGVTATRAFGFALIVAAICFVLSSSFTPRVAAQEPGTPPETQAPDADNSAQPADEAATDAAQEAPQAENPSATQPADPSASGQAATTVPQPDMPKWPINDKPGRATVTWDSHGLAVNAANSSLQQILKDVCTATGVKIEGLNTDERVFGEYGPGQARDVLSQLFQGAGYNVIMIGDQGQGAPRQILLSARRADSQQPGANRGQSNNNDDDSADNEADDQSVQPPPMRPGFPGGPARSPQQMMQDRQERLQQMRQQQGGSQPPTPQN
jgi:hypothetical protein